VSRIVDINIKRYVAYFKAQTLEITGGPADYVALVALVEDNPDLQSGFNHYLSGTNEFTFQVGSPSGPWIHSDDARTETYAGQQDNINATHKTINSQLHIFVAEIIDRTGRKTAVSNTIWYIPPSRLNNSGTIWNLYRDQLKRNPVNQTAYEQYKLVPGVQFQDIIVGFKGYMEMKPHLQLAIPPAEQQNYGVKYIAKDQILGVVEWRQSPGV